MLVDIEQINKAKEKLGDSMARIIAEELDADNFDERNLKMCCPWHNEDHPSCIWNHKELKYHCFGQCGRNYDIIDAFIKRGMTYIEAVQKLFELAKMPYSFGEVGIKTKHQYRYPKEEPLNEKEHVYEYWSKRGISKETIDYADVREDKHGNTVFNYYDTNNVLTMVKYRPSHKIDKTKGEIKNWVQTDSDSTPLLFNMNRVNVLQPLLITEGEGDCLAAIESGWSNSVSVPLGSQNFHWIEENFDWLEQFTSIIICSDNDEAGVKMKNECVMRLGAWRTKYVDIPRTVTRTDGVEIAVKDANEVLYYAGTDYLIGLIQNAKEAEIKSVVDFSEIKNVDIDNLDGIRTGFSSLDKRLMKLFYGTFNIVTGINGSGKSSFLSSLVCNALDDDKNVFMYSGELPNFQAKNWITYVLAGQRNINRYENEDTVYWKVTREAQFQIDQYYKSRFYLYSDAFDHKASSILQAMEDTCRRYGCKLFIIDNLTSVNLECNESNKYQKQEEFTTSLIDFAKKFNVCVIEVIHPHKIETMRRLTKMDVQGISALIDLSHRIISLYRVSPEDKAGFAKQNGKGWIKEPIKYDVLCDILKDRMLGYEGSTIGLYYDKPSRRFFETERDLDKKYHWDIKDYDGDLPYPPLQLTEEEEIFGKV